MESHFLISRQPIYTPKVDVAGYELCASDGAAKAEAAQSLDTAQAIFNICTDSGLDNIVGEHPCFVSMNPAALSHGRWDEVPKARVVLGYFSDFAPTDPHAHELVDLTEKGYRIALSDNLRPESLDILADLAYAIRVDVTSYLPNELKQRIQALRRYKSKILAEKVNTYDDLEFCKSLKVDLFQGHFLCKPSSQKNELPVSRLSMIRLLSKIQDPEITIPDLEKTISLDVSLSYKLLRYANSAALGLQRNVSSVGHAVRMVGLQKLRTWASVLLLSSVEDKPRELMNIALVRARMCEGLGESLKNAPKESFFSAGLLSVLDALLDCSIEQALSELPLTDEIRNALIQRSGHLGQALRCTVAYEQADWDEVQFYGMPPNVLRDKYMEAVSWARQLLTDLPNA